MVEKRSMTRQAELELARWSRGRDLLYGGVGEGDVGGEQAGD